MSNPIQKSPYLRQQRDFPHDDIKELSVQIDKAYIDIASSVNNRTIGIYALSNSVTTGEAWYLQGSSKKQQTLRQLYTFSAAGNIAHGIDLNKIAGFTRIYGTFTNGTNWYPLPYVDVSSATNQVNVYITPTNIVLTAGGGSPPTVTSGWIVLEWLSVP
jgi:hypothetical protein